MAHTIEEIKRIITNAYISNPEIIQQYGLDENKTFEEQFSKAAIESILFHDVAACNWVLETLFDIHKSDIDTELNNRLPHTSRWYRTKVLSFQFPKRDLIPETDRYDNTGLTPERIEELQVVKFCSVAERFSRLMIKVAKGEPGARKVLSNEEVAGLEFHLNIVKDAGVPFTIVNQQADKFFCKMDVYYNPMLLNPSDEIVEKTIKQYVSNLPFDGMLVNAFLVDEAQKIPGVVIPHLVEVKTKRAENPEEIVQVRTLPESGYFIVENSADVDVKYIPA